MTSGSTEVRIRWERRTIREAQQLAQSDRVRVVAAVESLRENPHRGTILHADWKGFRRLRVGVHRVIYAFDGAELLIPVVRVGHRREVYP